MRSRNQSGVVVLLSALTVLLGAAPTRAGAAEAARPQVVPAQSLPKDCKPLGEVKGKHSNESPREEAAQEDAVLEARDLGATHVVTGDIWRCSSHSICYEGKAYRCSTDIPAAPAK
jgi:hypothetical protein